MPLQDYTPAELAPRNLTKEQVDDPTLVFDELFDSLYLPQCREALWDLFTVCVTGRFTEQSPTDRENVVHIYKKLEKLVEAAHILHVRNKSQSVSK
jgi:hypothetical protein